MGDDAPALRIGNAERESAEAALGEHMKAGRLGVEEYADRSAKASVATTAAELTELFTDLPAPHPTLPGSPALQPSAVQPLAAAEPAVPDGASPVPARRGPMSTVGGRIAAASPILALILFFVLSAAGVQLAWLAFLLIPLVGALGFSKERQEERELERRDRRELRERRRDGRDD